MIKVCFLINSLGGGGAEKVLVNLVNNMDYERFEITIITMFGLGVNAKDVNSKVKIVNRNPLNIRGLSKILKYFNKSFLYKYYIREQYDIEIGYLQGATTLVLKNSKIPKIAWLHTDMILSDIKVFFFSEKQIRKCFETFSYVVGVSQSVSNSYKERFKINDNVKTIYNCIDDQRIKALSLDDTVNSYDNRLKLISIGRLSKEKGFDRLIKVIYEIVKRNINIKLEILGEGPEKSNLETLIKKYNLQKSVTLLGYKANPYPYLKNSDVFICSSYTEGLSTVICEAIILGIPVISTEVSGARELLGEEGTYGMIVENSEEGILNGILEVISDKGLLNHYRGKAKERSVIFNAKHSAQQVENLIESLIYF